MENYIVIKGKKAELTEEQLKALGIEVEKDDPFKRGISGNKYYYISSEGVVYVETDIGISSDYKCYNTANYCTDKALMEQRALHETLNRLLWRYSMQHGGEEIDWTNCGQRKFVIYMDKVTGKLDSSDYYCQKFEGSIYFVSGETAEAAIEEIVKPFMEQHPEFVW